jgi:glycosyltransferase involved in cell wall biosynthesis
MAANLAIMRIGVAVLTRNQRSALAATIDAVRRLTAHPRVDFVVADDGSTDGTPGWLRDNDVPVVTGPAMGPVWNRNRALFLLGEMLGCEAVVVLTADVPPHTAGWENRWLTEAKRWGYADDASGCAAYTREALLYGGYPVVDEDDANANAEHGKRLRRLGFGSSIAAAPAKHSELYRAPWRNDAEMRQFRLDIRDARNNRPRGFALSEIGGRR